MGDGARCRPGAARNILWAAVAFVAVTAGVGRLLPVPSDLDEKLDYFRAHASSYSVVFLGSSVVYRQIDPNLFDRELGNAGARSRSFNFGAPGMENGEADHLVHEIFSARPNQLRYLFLDVSLPSLGLGDPRTARFAAWHSVPATAHSLGAIWRARAAPGVALVAAWNDVRGFLHRATRAGYLSEIVDSSTSDMAAADGGFVPLDVAHEGAKRRRHGRFVREATRWLERRDQLVTEQPAVGPEARYQNELIARIAEECRAHGVVLLLVRAPSIEEKQAIVSDAPLFDFQDPIRYPELYQLSARFDGDHLNRVGAAIYTKLLAQRFAEWLRAVR